MAVKKMRVSGDKIRAVRQEQLFTTQTEIAEKAGVSVFTYQKAEAGEELSTYTIGKIARAMGVDPQEIVKQEDKEPAPFAEPSAPTPLDRFLQESKEFREEAREDPFSAREKLSAMAPAYVFAKRFVNNMPHGEEREKALQQLTEAQSARMWGVSRILNSRAGADLSVASLEREEEEAERSLRADAAG